MGLCTWRSLSLLPFLAFVIYGIVTAFMVCWKVSREAAFINTPISRWKAEQLRAGPPKAVLYDQLSLPPIPPEVLDWLQMFEARHSIRRCPIDPTLIVPAGPFFLAANFYNSEEVLPNFMAQVGATLLVSTHLFANH